MAAAPSMDGLGITVLAAMQDRLIASPQVYGPSEEAGLCCEADLLWAPA